MLHPTLRLCHHLGSSGRGPGLQRGPDSPGSLRLVKFCGAGSYHPRNPHYKQCSECYEGEGDRCSAKLLVNTQMAHLLSMQRATATVEDSQTVEKSGLSEYDKVVITKNAETIDAFSSHVIPVKTEKAYLGERINVMTQALQVEDGSLPQGLTVQNAYMELRTSTKNAVVVVRNSTTYSPNSQEENSGSMSCGSKCHVRATGNDPIAGEGGGTSHSSIT